MSFIRKIDLISHLTQFEKFKLISIDAGRHYIGVSMVENIFSGSRPSPYVVLHKNDLSYKQKLIEVSQNANGIILAWPLYINLKQSQACEYAEEIADFLASSTKNVPIAKVNKYVRKDSVFDKINAKEITEWTKKEQGANGILYDFINYSKALSLEEEKMSYSLA